MKSDLTFSCIQIFSTNFQEKLSSPLRQKCFGCRRREEKTFTRFHANVLNNFLSAFPFPLESVFFLLGKYKHKSGNLFSTYALLYVLYIHSATYLSGEIVY